MRRNTIAFAATAGLSAGFVQLASAADLPRPVPHVAAFTWTGFYVGVNAGGLFENSGTWNNDAAVTALNDAPNPATTRAALQAATSSFKQNGTGFVGGVQVGYNFQVAPRFVLGFETDIVGSRLRASGSTTVTAPVVSEGALPGSAFQTTATGQRQLDYLGTVRGRFGLLVQPDLLAFATGGVAYGGTKTSASFNQIGVINAPFLAPAPASGFGSVDKTLVGFTVGGGLEWKFSPNWSLGAQYLYYDLGRVSFGSSALTTNLGPSNFPGAGIVSVAPHTETRYTGLTQKRATQETTCGSY
jgi:outer membrane immunogenic protein